MEGVAQVKVGRVGVFKGAVSLALQDGLLTNGEKRMLVKLSHTLKLDEDEPRPSMMQLFRVRRLVGAKN